MELPFKQGDIVHVVGAMDNDGFYMAEINGSRGLVPSNFLQIVSSSSIHTPDPVGDESKAVTHSRTKHSSHKDSLKSVTMNHGVGEEVSGKLQPNALHVAISPLTGAGQCGVSYLLYFLGNYLPCIAVAILSFCFSCFRLSLFSFFCISFIFL